MGWKDWPLWLNWLIIGIGLGLLVSLWVYLNNYGKYYDDTAFVKAVGSFIITIFLFMVSAFIFYQGLKWLTKLKIPFWLAGGICGLFLSFGAFILTSNYFVGTILGVFLFPLFFIIGTILGGIYGRIKSKKISPN